MDTNKIVPTPEPGFILEQQTPMPEAGFVLETQNKPTPESGFVLEQATPPTTPGTDKPSFLKTLGGQFVDKIGGLAETGLAAASSIAAFPVGAAVKAGKILTTAQQAAFKPPDFAEINKVGNKAAELLTYQPKTEFGKMTSEILASPVMAIQEGIRSGAKALRYGPQAQEAIVAIGDVAIATLLPKLINETKKLGRVIPDAIYENSIKEVVQKGIDTGHTPEQMRVVERAIRQNVQPGTILEEVKRNVGVRKAEVRVGPKLAEPIVEEVPVTQPTVIPEAAGAQEIRISTDPATKETVIKVMPKVDTPVSRPVDMPAIGPEKPVEAKIQATPTPTMAKQPYGAVDYAKKGDYIQFRENGPKTALDYADYLSEKSSESSGISGKLEEANLPTQGKDISKLAMEASSFAEFTKNFKQVKGGKYCI